MVEHRRALPHGSLRRQGRSPFVDPVALPFPVRVDDGDAIDHASATSTRISSDGAVATISIVGSSTICAASPVSMRSPFTVDVALDHVEVDAATGRQVVRDRGRRAQARHEDVRVLVHEHGVAAVAADHPQQPVGAVLGR